MFALALALLAAFVSAQDVQPAASTVRASVAPARLSASTGQSVRATAYSARTGWNPGAGDIASIVLGVFCGLQFLGVLFLWLRLRSTRRRLALAEAGMYNAHAGANGPLAVHTWHNGHADSRGGSESGSTLSSVTSLEKGLKKLDKDVMPHSPVYKGRY